MDKKATSDNLLDELLSEITPKMQKRVTDKMLLAVKIYDAMTAMGYNQKEFAKKMGVGQSVVSRWLSGQQNFTTETLSDIETILKVSLFDNKPKVNEIKKLNVKAAATLRNKDISGQSYIILTSQQTKVTLQ